MNNTSYVRQRALLYLQTIIIIIIIIFQTLVEMMVRKKIEKAKQEWKG